MYVFYPTTGPWRNFKIKGKFPPFTPSNAWSKFSRKKYLFKLCAINTICFVDIDECSQQPCEINEHCKNLPGSYKCHCKSGYQLDKVTNACTGNMSKHNYKQ